MSFPASMRTVNPAIQHIQDVIFFQRKAIDNLKASLATYPCMEREPLPMKNGKTMQFYVNTLMNTNIVPISEGTPGGPIDNGSVDNTVTISQYGDYMSFSDLLDKTGISPIVKEQARELGYAAASSVDLLNYTQFDATAAADSVARIDSAINVYMTTSIARQAYHSLLARDVQPKDGGYFAGIMHPLVAFDYTNDNTAGGFLDIIKRNDYQRLKKGIQGNNFFTLDGINWVVSTKTPTTASFAAGGTGYHSYVIGKNAFLCTSLSFTDVPDEENFTARVTRFNPGDQLYDPLGLIAAVAWYKFEYATYVPPDGISRFRRLRNHVSIT
jgi:N4-gp56 family major capsid protein